MYFTVVVWKAFQERSGEKMSMAFTVTIWRLADGKQWHQGASMLQNNAKLTDLKYKMCTGPDKMSNIQNI